MQVFTAIYLAEPLHPSVRDVEETAGLASTLLSAREITVVLRPRIAKPEPRDIVGEGTR